MFGKLFRLRNPRRLRNFLVRYLLGRRRLFAMQFREHHGYEPDLDHPRSLSEKVMWIKLHHELDALSNYVDKISVREFVRQKIGESYLVPSLGYHDSFDEIDFDALPERFVLKATHGSKWNVIVRDKKTFDRQEAKARFDEWLVRKYAVLTHETCYRPIRGRILIEEYLEEGSTSPPDYKFYCYNGIVHGLHVHFDRFNESTYRVYDTEWREFKKTMPEPFDAPVIGKPENFDEMLEVCRKLSSGFSFVRVDLYNVRNRIYFGELTFTPGDGRGDFNPVWADYYFGEYLDLDTYKPYYNG